MYLSAMLGTAASISGAEWQFPPSCPGDRTRRFAAGLRRAEEKNERTVALDPATVAVLRTHRKAQGLRLQWGAG
jgi:hypothetical protein